MQLVPWCKPNGKGNAAYAGSVSPQIVVLSSFSILFFYTREGERKEHQDCQELQASPYLSPQDKPIFLCCKTSKSV